MVTRQVATGPAFGVTVRPPADSERGEVGELRGALGNLRSPESVPRRPVVRSLRGLSSGATEKRGDPPPSYRLHRGWFRRGKRQLKFKLHFSFREVLDRPARSPTFTACFAVRVAHQGRSVRRAVLRSVFEAL